MKLISYLTSLIVIFGISNATETYDFTDTQGTEYRLCSLQSVQVLSPQSDLERVCAQFMEAELNNEDTPKNARTQKPTEEEAVIPYFNRFMAKSAQLNTHRLLVLFQKNNEDLLPLGMGRVNSLEEQISFIHPDTIEAIQPFGGPKNCYIVGGGITQGQQGKGIASKVSFLIADIILRKIYKDLHSEQNPPFIYVGTNVTNQAVNHLCKKAGCKRLTNEEGRKIPNTQLEIMAHEYIYQ